MKYFLILILVISVSAMANQVTIKPGTSVIISPSATTTVACEGTAILVHYCKCTYKTNGWKVFRVNYVNGAATPTEDLVSDTYDSYSNCMSVFQRLQNLGLCSKE